MARYIGPVCRLCRREGTKLFLKGIKCLTDKCLITRRNFPPGQHGKMRRKLSHYGLQLREKQKVKVYYGILEKQFRKYFGMAAATKGVTGKVLLQLLERRLDNIILKAGFAVSRPLARQLVRHGAVCVNNKRVNIPSFLVKPGDSIQVKTKEKPLGRIKDNLQLTKDWARPGWLNIERESLSIKVIRYPEKEDISIPIQEQLIVELYSK